MPLYRVAFDTDTTGTGTVDVGSPPDASFLTPTEAGATNGQTGILYLLQEGTNFEIGLGVFNTGSPPTFERTTVITSKIGGTAGTSKISLTGTGRLRFLGPEEHEHDADYAAIGHDHDTDYAQLSGAVFTGAVQTTTIEAGHATDTTVARHAAGVISVEGIPLYPGIPVTDLSAAHTIVAANAQTALRHPASDNNARTFTIDSNTNLALPVGTVITFINEINVLTIAITADTLVLAGSGATGSRSLAANGIATAIKVASTRWYISGTALT